MVEKSKFIWMDGEFVDWDDAKIHILTHSFQYGLAAFEGIRAYETTKGLPAIFRLDAHIKRLFDSAHIAMMKVQFSKEEISNACINIIKKNSLASGYIRPVIYIGEGAMGVYPASNPIKVVIAAWKWGSYLGEEALKKGIRARVSSFNRFFVNSVMTKAKITGNYASGILAKQEAVAGGFQEAIMLDTEGYVAEGTGENVFIVRSGVIKTSPLTSILEGITRDSIITIAKDMGFNVSETRFTRDELYVSDEVFFSGTAAEITPVVEVDGRKIGDGVPGLVTKKLQSTFFDIVKGKNRKYEKWLTYIK